ncbi:MAG TPA: ATP-binding protein [Methanofastidiosum sp.]|nr:ATP-binding protein [Methanofastidiosum sp.]
MDKKERKCLRCDGNGVIKVPDSQYLEGFRLELCGCKWTEKDFNIPTRYIDKGLSNFEGHEKLLKFLESYVEEYKEGQQGLYFHGPNGVGKTHLAVALIKEFAQVKGIRGRYISYVDLLALKREKYAQNNVANIIESFEKAELLVLDDLGVEKESSWVMEQTTSLIDFRYRSCLTTIITSNYSLENLKYRFEDIVVGYRIVSRLTEMCVVIELGGKDYRFRSFREKKYEG